MRHRAAAAWERGGAAFTVAEAKGAREAFLTSTTADLLPIVRIDGEPVGEGRPGPLAQKLRAAYFAHAAGAA
ncbi:D-alanine aminotransferase [compost metagenome]